MNIFYRILFWIAGICVSIYLAVCCILYFNQETMIFPRTKLQPGYKFMFPAPFQEYTINTADGKTLNACLFTVSQSKGVIFYLHGNGGNMEGWGSVAKYYNALGYDLFMVDYPGYGKSTGNITSLQQLFSAVNTAYVFVKQKYPENQIIILGYSIGTGPAAWLASQRNPKKLILLAPYYSLPDMVQKLYPYLPSFILKYQINTYQYIGHVKAPVIIFHGDIDDVIYHGSSLKLKAYFKPGDTLITLHNQSHENIDENQDYLNALKGVLN